MAIKEILDRSKSKSTAFLPSRVICSGRVAKDTSAAPGVTLKAAGCPWGTPEACRQLGTRLGARGAPARAAVPAAWDPLAASCSAAR